MHTNEHSQYSRALSSNSYRFLRPKGKHGRTTERIAANPCLLGRPFQSCYSGRNLGGRSSPGKVACRDVSGGCIVSLSAAESLQTLAKEFPYHLARIPARAFHGWNERQNSRFTPRFARYSRSISKTRLTLRSIKKEVGRRIASTSPARLSYLPFSISLKTIPGAWR